MGAWPSPEARWSGAAVRARTQSSLLRKGVSGASLDCRCHAARPQPGAWRELRLCSPGSVGGKGLGLCRGSVPGLLGMAAGGTANGPVGVEAKGRHGRLLVLPADPTLEPLTAL